MRKTLFALLFAVGLLGAIVVFGGDTTENALLGLPPVPIPEPKPFLLQAE